MSIAGTYTCDLERQSYDYGNKLNQKTETKKGFGFHQSKRKITQIDKGSPAQKSGMKVGDIIHSCKIKDSFSSEIKTISEGDDIRAALSVDIITLHLVRGSSVDKMIGKYVWVRYILGRITKFTHYDGKTC